MQVQPASQVSTMLKGCCCCFFKVIVTYVFVAGLILGVWTWTDNTWIPALSCTLPSMQPKHCCSTTTHTTACTIHSPALTITAPHTLRPLPWTPNPPISINHPPSLPLKSAWTNEMWRRTQTPHCQKFPWWRRKTSGSTTQRWGRGARTAHRAPQRL